jgi:hypothetical protein
VAHDYDISDVLGHIIQSVTGTYARHAASLQEAVNKLAEPRGRVLKFEMKASSQFPIVVSNAALKFD